jgi:hypothetical protein
MRSLTNLNPDQLNAARDAAATLMRHKVFLPRSGLLVMLLSKLRDDTREAAGTRPAELPARHGTHERAHGHGHGPGFRSLDEMTTTELNAVTGAVSTLLEARISAEIDDPELPRLLRLFDEALTQQKTEREQLRAAVA